MLLSEEGDTEREWEFVLSIHWVKVILVDWIDIVHIALYHLNVSMCVYGFGCLCIYLAFDVIKKSHITNENPFRVATTKKRKKNRQTTTEMGSKNDRQMFMYTQSLPFFMYINIYIYVYVSYVNVTKTITWIWTKSQTKRNGNVPPPSHTQSDWKRIEKCVQRWDSGERGNEWVWLVDFHSGSTCPHTLHQYPHCVRRFIVFTVDLF